jgi:hypothetical protein
VPLFAPALLSQEQAVALSFLFAFLGVVGNLPGGLLMLAAPSTNPRVHAPKT